MSEEVILGVRDCSLWRVPRTSHRLYMHDLEDGKASLDQIYPSCPSVKGQSFYLTVSAAYERFLANYESDSELNNTNRTYFRSTIESNWCETFYIHLFYRF